MRITVCGGVQGVGFRPFIYRLAESLHLKGWIKNNLTGVLIEVEGIPAALETFLNAIPEDAPPPASIQGMESVFLDPVGFSSFQILKSDANSLPQTFVPADIAVCDRCLEEVFDPGNRRYRYPFINCTHCGPRYSIIEALPYDRDATTMRCFAMCDACRSEYEDRSDRRFHAQPIACPDCGPQIRLWDQNGRTVLEREQALQSAVTAIRSGQIVAVKGLGGFHLMADACSERAVQRLRQRKGREEKPFALMYPNLAAIEKDCVLNEQERRLLQTPEAPIVLVACLPDADIARNVAPGSPYLGVMLPSTPLHHLLMQALKTPAVATSGNLNDEPICIDENDALVRLSRVADCFLIHDRPILRHVDDSIVRIIAGRETILRRARGYAPYPISMKAPQSTEVPFTCLAVGGQLKSTVAVTRGADIFISQHIGDLETALAYDAYERVSADLPRLLCVDPSLVICDDHPDYRSTRYAENLGKPMDRIQHHYAHILACMTENEIEEPVLGIAWDGAGYGTDGTVWGGECLAATWDTYKRLACIRPFHLIGGEKAVRQPRRSAFSLLYELFGEEVVDRTDLYPVRNFQPDERRILVEMLQKRINTPLTSSAGRLFDAAASIMNLCHHAGFEGQAAMQLEFAVGASQTAPYPMPVCDSTGSPENVKIIDWMPMVRAMIEDITNNISNTIIARKFHDTLACAIADTAEWADIPAVVLTGGCFQNVYLCERTIQILEDREFRVYRHQRVPPNDGGLALGQAAYGLMNWKSLTDN